MSVGNALGSREEKKSVMGKSFSAKVPISFGVATRTPEISIAGGWRNRRSRKGLPLKI